MAIIPQMPHLSIPKIKIVHKSLVFNISSKNDLTKIVIYKLLN